jgi:hypothetical protein
MSATAVKTGSRGLAAGCLLCPGERTSSGCLGMSEKCPLSRHHQFTERPLRARSCPWQDGNLTSALPPNSDKSTRSVLRICAYKLASNSSHLPGRPFSSCGPRLENFRPAPATRSVTTRDTRTSLGRHFPITRAAACTAMPPISCPLISTSPVCSPARRGKPICLAAAPNAKAQRTARPGSTRIS